jgi:hypothetical protein
VTTGNAGPWTAAEQERRTDDEHLKLLMIGFYVLGGVTGVVALIPLIPRRDGGPLRGRAAVRQRQPTTGVFGWLFIGIGTVAILVGEAVAALNIAAGRAIQRRRSRTLVMVASIIDCLQMPLGTVLGVFALVTLGRARCARSSSVDQRPQPAQRVPPINAKRSRA